MRESLTQCERNERNRSRDCRRSCDITPSMITTPRNTLLVKPPQERGDQRRKIEIDRLSRVDRQEWGERQIRKSEVGKGERLGKQERKIERKERDGEREMRRVLLNLTRGGISTQLK